MAVKMRLRREGKRKQPFYRVVVADARFPRDGRFTEDLGYYQPLAEPSEVSIDSERALYWLRNGAQPSDAVRQLLRIQGIWEEFKPGDPGRDRSAKNAAKAKAKARAESQQPAAADEPSAPGESEAAAAEETPAPPAEAAAQALAEDTQPDPGPAEETGAIAEDEEKS